MNIKLIALDMDGTLLNKDNQIMEKTKQILIEAQKRGVILVLASGRSYSRLMFYAKELMMDVYGGYLIEVNGVAIYDVKHQKRYIYGKMPKENAQELFEYFSKWNVEIMGQLDRGMYDYNPKAILDEKREYRKNHNFDEDYPWTGGTFTFLADTRKGYPDIRYIEKKEEILEDVNKVTVTYWPEYIQEVAKVAKKELKDRYWVGLTSDKWLEILMPNITKGFGLSKLSKILHIPYENMMAIGDGENDIDMIRLAGVGVAMENALLKVKENADDVTLSNNEDGVYEAIKRYVSISMDKSY